MEKLLTTFKNVRPDIIIFEKNNGDEIKSIGFPGNMQFIIEVKKCKKLRKDSQLESPLLNDIT